MLSPIVWIAHPKMIIYIYIYMHHACLKALEPPNSEALGVRLG